MQQLPGGDLLSISLQEDLTVFYGLNGAGKSTVLRGIESALTGLRGDLEVTLYVQFVELDGQVGEPLDPMSLAGAICRAGRGREVSLPSLRDRALEQLRAMSLPQDRATDETAWQEVSAQGLFALTPLGGNDPRWRVRIAAQHQPHSMPGFSRMLEDLRHEQTLLVQWDGVGPAPGRWDSPFVMSDEHPLLGMYEGVPHAASELPFASFRPFGEPICTLAEIACDPLVDIVTLASIPPTQTADPAAVAAVLQRLLAVVGAGPDRRAQPGGGRPSPVSLASRSSR